MAWITSNSVSVSNGSKTVTVTGNVDLSAVDEGWAVQIGSNPIVEASSGTAPDGNGSSTLTLMNDWPNADATSAAMSIIPNSGYQITLADRIKAILARTVNVMQLQHDYASQLGQVTATDPDTNQQHVYNTLRQNQQEMDDLLASLGSAAGYDVTESSSDDSVGANGLPRLMRVGDGSFLTEVNNYAIPDFDDERKLIPKYHGNAGNNRPESIGVLLPLTRQGYGMQIDFCASGETYTRPVYNHNFGVWNRNLHTGNTGSIVTEDYEEGTWTPLVRTGSSTGFNTAITQAKYKKIGDVVFLSATGTLTRISNVATDQQLYIAGGVPFSVDTGVDSIIAHSFTNPTTGSLGGSVMRNNTSDFFISTDYIVPAGLTGEVINFSISAQYFTS